MFRKLSLPLVTAALVLVLTGCVASGPKPAEAIIGQWQSSVGKFPLVVQFAAQTVQVGDNEPVLYGLDGDQLTYADGGKQVRIVSFPDSATMVQLDPVTGTEHQFSRIEPTI